MFVFKFFDGKMKSETPCGENSVVYLSSIMINGQEEVAASCHIENDIKMFNQSTGKWSTFFKGECSNFCFGGSGIIFTQLRNNSICQLNVHGRKPKPKTFHTEINMTIKNMCYIPSPTDALVLRYWDHSLVAISVEEYKVLWKFPDEKEKNGVPENKERVKDRTGLFFYPTDNVLFVAEGVNRRVLILKPEDGSLLQIIDLPDVDHIVALDRFYNQIIMLYEDGEGHDYKISFYKIVSPNWH